jgi:predicted TIM-barrel fold metal-dependent hydrolase
MIDGHVHIVGTGAGGTGCWLRRRGAQRLLEPFLMRAIGLPRSALDGDFDRLYVERLLELVRDAGISQALILAQDDVYTDDGKCMTDTGAFYVPNDRVLELARLHPEFVPAVSIHPARPDALEELERCLAAGAAVMKILPNCHNIDPGLPQYRRFWERMAAARLPLLAHTGGEKVLPEVRRELADPRALIAPLEIGVTVIAAHCATAAPGSPDYFPYFVEMLQRYPNLYGDVSALSFPRKARSIPTMLRPEVVSRIINGSDFPVPVRPFWCWIGGRLSLRDFWRTSRIGNTLARDVALKKALGFPPEIFTRIAGIWRTGGG